MRHGGAQQLAVDGPRQHQIVREFRLAGDLRAAVDAASRSADDVHSRPQLSAPEDVLDTEEKPLLFMSEPLRALCPPWWRFEGRGPPRPLRRSADSPCTGTGIQRAPRGSGRAWGWRARRAAPSR